MCIRDRTRTEYGPELMMLCDDIFASADSRTWAERLDAAGMVWGLIQTLDEVIVDPQSDALGAFKEIPDSEYRLRTVAPPFDLRGSEVSIKGPAPRHGEHSLEVLAEVGFSEQEINDLFEKKIVS